MPKKGTLLVLVLAGIIVIFSFGYLLGRQSLFPRFLPPTAQYPSAPSAYPYLGPVSPTPLPGPKCPQYRTWTNDELYLKYAVKPGDSVLSVAKKQLGSASKIDEIIALNKDRYPYIESNSFLEVGWILYLPDPGSGIDNYRIGGISGKVADITDQYFGVAYPSSIIYIYYSRSPQYATNLPVKVGDCVDVKYYGRDQIPYSISFQSQESRPQDSLILDFASCQPIRQRIDVPFGSTTYQITGADSRVCLMDYGGEVENPNWDGELTSHCRVPTGIGTVTFAKGTYGVDFSPIEKYCTQ